MTNPSISKLLKIISNEISRESGSNSGVYDSKHKSYNGDRYNQKNIMRQEKNRNKNYMRNKTPNAK